jgi:hypothetical protein
VSLRPVLGYHHPASAGGVKRSTPGLMSGAEWPVVVLIGLGTMVFMDLVGAILRRLRID